MKKLQNGAARFLAAAVASVAASGLLAAAGAAPAVAAAASCWRASEQHTVKKLTVKVLDSGFTYRWCAQGGKVTGFVIENWHSVVRNSAWASDARGDIQPTMRLGQDRLHIYADFSAKSTVAGKITVARKFAGAKAKANVSWTPGRFGDHYEINLWPNGTLTGDSWKS
ncbi:MULTISPECIES: hypothetical protein [Actinoplanes]|uniref:Uncharacterized protein n=2 Tax=Actinoplanes TaxID=1865 RepID=A0A0X3VBX8_9ACTN|nr:MULTISPECIES: hypothetical protein [Actinoplanes]KUL42313.1 hypothetical protein ADL15_00015 [Actinoplanes awajinensis subsp. mycoplanecinus]GIE64819.1 hypothetical protein Apa02nite_009270 [Actinoplanes palleronii]